MADPPPAPAHLLLNRQQFASDVLAPGGLARADYQAIAFLRFKPCR
jgi:hypothetical protein